jgi:molybdenum transport protein
MPELAPNLNLATLPVPHKTTVNLESVMRSFLSNEAIARLIEEDVPYLDLTTFGLGIAQQPGRLEFYTRHPTVICATEEAAKVIETCGAEVQSAVPSGTVLDAQALILSATGTAEALHIAWRVALNLMEYTSGIATRTADFVKSARAANPNVSVVTTRKAFPGTRALMMKAIIAGGALPHRLGLSESILIFKQHLMFLGGMEGLIQQLPNLKQTFQEKKIAVEVETIDDAWTLAAAGVDMLQLDKVPLETLKQFVPEFKQRYPTLTLAAAGGITADNGQTYAATGIDLLVTSALYFGKPADIAAKMVATKS